MGVDRLDYLNTGAIERARLTPSTQAFLDDIEEKTAVPIAVIGTGFRTANAIVSPVAPLTPAIVHA